MARKFIKISNAFLVIYLAYIIYVWLSEALNLCLFLLGYEQATLISRIVVAILILILYAVMRDRIVIERRKPSFFAYAFLTLIALFGIIKSCYPDVGYDTGNYHILAQSREFINWFEKGYGAGNFQVWGFRLGDRLFTLFREFFGYRYGTILNTLIIMLIYIQIVDLLYQCIHNLKVKCKKVNYFFLELIAVPVVFVHDMVMEVGTYYVDILAIPLCIELVKKICIDEQKDQNIFEYGYIAFLMGIVFALKLTNIVYIIPLLIMYLWNNYTKIKKIGEWFACILLGIMPCSIYMVFNFVCTGNPVFPYFNTIFKSQYFLQSNFKDMRWGGQGILEKILWLFYHIFRPDYRQSEIPNKYTYVMAVSLIFIMIIFFIRGVKRITLKNKNYFFEKVSLNLFIFILASSFLWSFTTGYSRYFLLGDMMIIFLSVLLVIEYVNGENHRRESRIVVTIVIFLSLLAPVLEIRDNLNGIEWSWRKVDVASLQKQSRNIFKDHLGEKKLLSVDVFLLTDITFNKYAYLINWEAEIFNANYINYLDNEKEQNNYEEKLLKIINSKENIYDIKTEEFEDWDNYEENLSTMGLSLSEKLEINIENNGQRLLLIKLKKVGT